jgi:hypothetical protein
MRTFFHKITYRTGSTSGDFETEADSPMSSFVSLLVVPREGAEIGLKPRIFVGGVLGGVDSAEEIDVSELAVAAGAFCIAKLGL